VWCESFSPHPQVECVHYVHYVVNHIRKLYVLAGN
jgi:hypothetical protein